MAKCDVCGRKIEDGFCDGRYRICEEDFESFMDETYGILEWRPNGHEDEPSWDGGYYDFYQDGKWYDTEFYWTEWED